MLAIDFDSNLVYEGRSGYGRAVWPVPVVSIATLIDHEEALSEIPGVNDLAFANLVFREDSFDSVSRLKRGRFYSFLDGTRNPVWNVQIHPMLPGESRLANGNGWIQKQLWNWHVCSFSSRIKSYSRLPLVALGTANAHSLWRIVGIEAMINGEELVTLRLQANLGVLPDVDADKIPEISRQKLMESVDKLVETVYRAGPESIVSRCRDAAAAILGAFLWDQDPKAPVKDLGDLIKILKKPQDQEQKTMIISTATIIARLHPREKPNEQIGRNLRPILEGDADLAVNCIATLLRETGYSKA